MHPRGSTMVETRRSGSCPVTVSDTDRQCVGGQKTSGRSETSVQPVGGWEHQDELCLHRVHSIKSCLWPDLVSAAETEDPGQLEHRLVRGRRRLCSQNCAAAPEIRRQLG